MTPRSKLGKHPTSHKRTKHQKQGDEDLIARLTVQGWTVREITEEIARVRAYRLSDVQVANDQRALRKRWREESVKLIDDQIQRELKGLDWQERELIAAWERSKKDAESETKETVLLGGKKKLPGVKVTKHREGQVGAVAFQNTLLEIRRHRRELLGLDKPKKIASTTPDGEQSAPMVIAVSPEELPKARKPE